MLTLHANDHGNGTSMADIGCMCKPSAGRLISHLPVGVEPSSGGPGCGPIQPLPLRAPPAVAGNRPVLARRLETGLSLAADRLHEPAARVEPARLRRVHRVRHVAGQDDPLPAGRRIGNRELMGKAIAHHVVVGAVFCAA